MQTPHSPSASDTPDVSFVTSLYRSARHLPVFLRHVERATRELRGFGITSETIIILNDPDRQEQRALQRFGQGCLEECRVTLLTVPREGIYASWNRGVAAANARVIGFWNVDDIRNPQAVVEGVRLITGGERLVAFPWVIVRQRSRWRTCVHESARFHDTAAITPDNAFREFVIGPFFLFERSLFEEYGPFDEQFHIVGDFDWQLRLAPHVQLCCDAHLGGVFLADGSNLSSTGSTRLRIEQNVLFRRHGMSNPEWVLDDSSKRLFASYAISSQVTPSAGGRMDFAFDDAWLKRKRWRRLYSATRGRLGLRARLNRRLRGGGDR